MGIHIKEFNSIFRQDLLHALAHERLGSVCLAKAIHCHWEVPATCRAIPAFRQPDSPRLSAKESPVSFNASFDLRADGFICAEQGKVSMRGAASNDFDGAGFVEIAETLDDVA